MFRLIILVSLFASVFIGIIFSGCQLINVICEHKIDEEADEEFDEDVDSFLD